MQQPRDTSGIIRKICALKIKQLSLGYMHDGRAHWRLRYMVAVAGGENIKCSKYATFGTKNLSRNIIKALKNRSACLISNHGQVAFGENLEKAFELAQEIENICHQYINALRIGIPKILSKKEMKIVLGKFKNYKEG